MITDDYILARYIRERFPYLERSFDYALYAANIKPSELFGALKRYTDEMEGKMNVASNDPCGGDSADADTGGE